MWKTMDKWSEYEAARKALHLYAEKAALAYMLVMNAQEQLEIKRLELKALTKEYDEIAIRFATLERNLNA